VSNEVKWIKIVPNIFDDEKILLLESMDNGDSLIVVWFKLLCLAGKIGNNGVFFLNDSIPYTDEMLSTIFRRKLNTVRVSLNIFKKLGMIDIIDGVISIPKWEKHQNVKFYEVKNEYQKNYMRSVRAKQKEIRDGASNKNVSLTVSQKESNVSALDRDRELETDNDRSLDTLKSTGQKKTKHTHRETLDDFLITDEHRKIAASKGVNVEMQRIRFIAHKKSKGSHVYKPSEDFTYWLTDPLCKPDSFGSDWQRQKDSKAKVVQNFMQQSARDLRNVFEDGGECDVKSIDAAGCFGGNTVLSGVRRFVGAANTSRGSSC
jgi:predicted phage replisome organizer